MEKHDIALFHEQFDAIGLVEFLVPLDPEIRLVHHPVPIRVLMVIELVLMRLGNDIQRAVLLSRIL